MIIRPLDLRHDWDWINARLGIVLCEDTMGMVAVDEVSGERLSVCVMDNWTNNSVQAHLMILKAKAVRHGFLQQVAHYIFEQRGRAIIYGMVPDNNAAAKRLNSHMGFTIAARLVEAFDKGIDYLVMEGRRVNVMNALKMVT